MKLRKAAVLLALAAVVMTAGTLIMPSDAQADPVLQDPPTKTMWIVGRGAVLVVPLYDEPNPLGKAMKKLPAGTTVEVTRP